MTLSAGASDAVPHLQFGTERLTETLEAAHAAVPLVAPAGGDFHAAFPLPSDDRGSGSVGFVLGDVSGHGPEAAVQADRLKRTISGLLSEGISPGEALGFANAAAATAPEFTGFATVVAGTISPAGDIHYASAGHEPALISPDPHDTSDTVVQETVTTGPPVGILPADEARYRTERATLPPGGTLLLYSDGATEARRGRTFVGVERMRSWLAAFCKLPPLRLVTRVLGRVRAFAGGRFRDDVALLALRRHR
jgi:sigma-B regulation protein RsbU (phosphoserine phosphatase)